MESELYRVLRKPVKKLLKFVKRDKKKEINNKRELPSAICNASGEFSYQNFNNGVINAIKAKNKKEPKRRTRTTSEAVYKEFTGGLQFASTPIFPRSQIQNKSVVRETVPKFSEPEETKYYTPPAVVTRLRRRTRIDAVTQTFGSDDDGEQYFTPPPSTKKAQKSSVQAIRELRAATNRLAKIAKYIEDNDTDTLKHTANITPEKRKKEPKSVINNSANILMSANEFIGRQGVTVKSKIKHYDTTTNAQNTPKPQSIQSTSNKPDVVPSTSFNLIRNGNGRGKVQKPMQESESARKIRQIKAKQKEGTEKWTSKTVLPKATPSKDSNLQDNITFYKRPDSPIPISNVRIIRPREALPRHKLYQNLKPESKYAKFETKASPTTKALIGCNNCYNDDKKDIPQQSMPKLKENIVPVVENKKEHVNGTNKFTNLPYKPQYKPLQRPDLIPMKSTFNPASQPLTSKPVQYKLINLKPSTTSQNNFKQEEGIQSPLKRSPLKRSSYKMAYKNMQSRDQEYKIKKSLFLYSDVPDTKVSNTAGVFKDRVDNSSKNTNVDILTKIQTDISRLQAMLNRLDNAA